MTRFNWPAEIGRVCILKEMAAEAAPRTLSPWSPPKRAAKPDEIAAAEAAVGFGFPEAYRDFLRHANGWDGVFYYLSLFGTSDLISGRAREVMKRPGLIEAVARIGFGPGQYVPVGAGAELDEDVFLLVRPGAPVLAGGVVWVDPEDVSESERFSSFDEFFVSIIEHNEFLLKQAQAIGRH